VAAPPGRSCRKHGMGKDASAPRSLRGRPTRVWHTRLHLGCKAVRRRPSLVLSGWSA
jgi:hypothetical protein